MSSIESGLGWSAFTVDDSGGNARDIRTSTFNLDWTMPRGVQDITGASTTGRTSRTTCSRRCRPPRWNAR